jgi:hypothetical protein
MQKRIGTLISVNETLIAEGMKLVDAGLRFWRDSAFLGFVTAYS